MSFVDAAYDGRRVSIREVMADARVSAVLDPYLSSLATQAEREARASSLLDEFWASLEEAEEERPSLRIGVKAPLSNRQHALILARLMFYESVGADGVYSNRTERRDAAVAFPHDHPMTHRRVDDHRDEFLTKFTSELKLYISTSSQLQALLPDSTHKLETTPADSPDALTSIAIGPQITPSGVYEEAPTGGHIRSDELASGADLSDLMKQLKATLMEPPDHYPKGITTRWLGRGLRVATPDKYQYMGDLDEGRPDYLIGGVNKNPISLLAGYRRAVIVGDPGAGKSTVLKGYLADKLRTHKKSVGVFVPLALISRRAKASPPKSLTDALRLIVESFREWYPRLISAEDAIELERELHSAKAILCLDGLDEVDDPDEYAAVLELLRRIDEGPAQIVLSSRATGYRRPIPETAEFLIDDLGNQQITRFFRRWFARDETDVRFSRLIELQRRFPQIRRLARNPMMAGMVAYVAEEPVPPTDLGLLYKRYISHFLRKIWKLESAHRDNDVAEDLLVEAAVQIAWTMATSAADSEWQVDRWAAEITGLDATRAANNPQAADALLRTDGLLVLRGVLDPRAATSERRYAWLHRSIHEHLVGRYLADWYVRAPEDALEYILDAAWRPRTWTQALIHMTALLEPGARDDVIRRVTQRTPDSLFYEAVRRGILQAVPQLVNDSPVRVEHLNDLLTHRWWRDAFELDPAATIDFVVKQWTNEPEEAFELDEVDWQQVEAHERQLLPNVDLLREVLGRPQYKGNFAGQLLARVDTQQFVEAMTRRVEGGHGLTEPLPLKDLVVSSRFQRKLLRAVEEAQIPSKWQLASLLESTTGGPELLTEAAAQSATLHAELRARYIPTDDRYIQHEHLDPQFEADALRGRYGDWVAAAVGHNSFTVALAMTEAVPWATAFAYLAALWQSPFSELASLPIPANVPPRRPSVVLAAPFEDNQSPESLVRTLYALHQTLVQGGQAGLKAIGRFYTSLKLNQPRREGLPEIDAHDLRRLTAHAYRELASELGWNSAWPVIQKELVAQRRSYFGDLRPTEEALNVLLLPGSVREGGRTVLQYGDTSRFIEIVTWGSRRRVPVLDVLPIPMRDDALLAQVLKVANGRYLSLPRNAKVLAEWATESGSLPVWRRRLFRIDRWRAWRQLWSPS